jgi:hypothetical protein
MEHRLDGMNDMQALAFIRDALAFRFAGDPRHDDAMGSVFDGITQLERDTISHAEEGLS